MEFVYNFPHQERGATVLFYPTPFCPVGCKYCFETPFKYNKSYDKKAMKNTFISLMDHLQFKNVILHGGEPLKLPIKDFEYFFKLASQYVDHPSLQTSLWGLTDKHIAILKEYKVSIGVSIDGPQELNSLRGPRDPVLNQKFQLEINKNLERLKTENMNPGVISILTKTNTDTKEKLDRLIEWSRTKTGGGRFNPMFVPNFDPNHPCHSDVLSSEEFKNVWLYLLEASIQYSDFNPAFVSEMRDNLLGFHLASCTFARCDYLTTQCMTILPDGGLSRCDRCLQDGYHYRAQTPTQQRAFMLEQTECKGCKYWNVCGGGCPGEALNKNYRAKTEFCEAYYAVYKRLEDILRRSYPYLALSIDVPNFFEEFQQKGRVMHEHLRLLREDSMRPKNLEQKEKGNQCENENQNRPHSDHDDVSQVYHVDGNVKGFVSPKGRI